MIALPAAQRQYPDAGLGQGAEHGGRELDPPAQDDAVDLRNGNRAASSRGLVKLQDPAGDAEFDVLAIDVQGRHRIVLPMDRCHYPT